MKAAAHTAPSVARRTPVATPHPGRPLIALAFEGLSEEQKELPFVLAYDMVGGALFERLCEQPEYYLGRAETLLLERHAAEISRWIGSQAAIVEYGAGTARSTPLLLRALHDPFAYLAIDVCAQQLEQTCAQLQRRFRSLPIARSAVISGRVIGDLVFNAFVLLVLVLCGLAVGWRWHNGLPKALAAMAILLGLTFAMLWIGALIGLSVRSAEVASSAGLIWLFPLSFISSCFVDPSTMPEWMQPIAEWNPISVVASAVRQLCGNPNPFASDGFQSQHPVLLSWIYIIAIVAVFAPLAVRKYGRATAR